MVLHYEPRQCFLILSVHLTGFDKFGPQLLNVLDRVVCVEMDYECVHHFLFEWTAALRRRSKFYVLLENNIVSFMTGKRMSNVRHQKYLGLNKPPAELKSIPDCMDKGRE